MPTQLKILVPGEAHVVDLVGQRDELLKRVERAFSADILVRGNEITITGEDGDAQQAATVFEELIALLRKGQMLTAETVDRAVQMVKSDDDARPSQVMGEPLLVIRGRTLRAKTAGQKRYVDAIKRNTLVFAVGPAGTGKCVASDTVVLTDRGMVEIGGLPSYGEYTPVDLEVHGLEGRERASHVYDGGETDTLRITTRLGFSIEATPEHPLLVLDVEGDLVWRRADTLRRGDVLALQRGQRMFGDTTEIGFTYAGRDSSSTVSIERLDEDLAYVMGLLTGDGCLTQRSRVVLSSADEEAVDAFHALADRLGLHVFRSGVWDHVIGSSQLYRLLEHLGMSLGTARTKRIPWAVLRAPESVVCAYLRGLFDADASVERRDGNVTFSTVSDRLATQVQVVLLNLGVVANRSLKHGTYLGRPHESWLLTMAGSESERFHDAVGFGLARKGIVHARVRNTNVDVVPHAVTRLSSALRTTRMPRAAHKRVQDYRTGRRRPSYAKLGALVGVLDAHGASGDDLDALRGLLDRGLLFLEVRDIAPGRAHVLDLTVPGSHSFVANGFVSHNTYMAVAMAVRALKEKEISRIVLTRPAVEAGERLGYLPGDIAQKVDPYLKPLYDALYEMLELEHFGRLMERGTIEVAPLAFMRGRAQPYGSRVLTPSGFRRIGDLRIGDEVIGSDGAPTAVLGIYPQGRRPVFRVRAQDGAETLCCEEHLWSVTTAHDRRRGKPARIMQTRDMVGQLRAAHRHRFELPLVSRPVALPARDVPMDPYALGLLLGDGCITGSTTPSFSTADPDLAEALGAGLDDVEVFAKGGVDYILRRDGGGGRDGVITANPVTAVLRDLDLCGSTSATKFVPEAYLYNSVDVRLAVLQGLLDTDGGPVTQANRTCRVQYSTTSARLRDDVVFLVRSLGGVAYAHRRPANGRPPGRARGRDIHHRHDAYIIDIRLPAGVAPFRLGRKRAKYDENGGGRPMRFVHAIEPAGVGETVCIKVAAPDSLYVTDDFLVTHNTLNDSFIILDEAQNTTPEQMKMFLTRLGLRSKAVVTGDVTQMDLPEGSPSGLVVVQQILKGIEGLEIVNLDAADVVRHKIVQEIVAAYERYDDGRRRSSESR